MQVRLISNITKEYNDMIQVIVYRNPRPFVISDNCGVRTHRSDEPTISSLKRTKSLISDLVLCNKFDLFCTFTFSPKYHIDRYNEAQCRQFLSRWLHHQKERTSPDLAFLAVPEKHKDGALHFHVLLKNYCGSLSDSKVKQNSRSVYNITSWRAGFSTAVRIDNHEAVSIYVRKYITKDFCKTYNKHRFFCSQGLARPIKHVNSDFFKKTPPLFRHKVCSTDCCDIYNIPKECVVDF